MINVKFDGKKEAERLAGFLEESERVLGKSLVIFQCDGRTEMSQYVKLKTEMGERLGVMVHVVFAHDVADLKNLIVESNEDEMVDGILIQLPIIESKELENFPIESRILDKAGTRTQELKMLKGVELFEILGMIKPSKDVDGLNPKSKFLPAVVRAVERIIEIFFENSRTQKLKNSRYGIALVGAKGMVGKRVGERLKFLGLSFEGFDVGDDLSKLKNFEVIISVTGKEELIKTEMVRDGFVGIDLGYPKGDFSPEAVAKASLISPVPKGVGPLTVVELFENLAEV